MKLAADLTAFAARIGHRFQRPGLLITAVTHASIAAPTRPDNQRLEFLGDRVLGLVMAEALLSADTGASEASLRHVSMRWCGKRPARMLRALLVWVTC